MHRILIIDDEDSVRDVLETFFTKRGFQVFTASDGRAGLELLKEEKLDLFLVDLVMPHMGGLDVIREAAFLNITIPSIIITGYGTVQTAVDAMKLGAFDYITKPFILDELMLIVNRAINVSNIQKENLMLKMQLKKKYNFKGIIGDSPPMQEVYQMIERVADTDSTILITGESGTGKELIAKTIHFNSSRSQNPFVPLNCAAIPKDLLESELFGHEKGAFTGALNTRIGRFELANNGTLFLDEIAELDPSLQVKMLRVLQEREFERVGGVRTIKVDVRILVATNKDLEKATAEGKFREDLYYRLNVIPLHLPPLRSRNEDIPLLLDYFTNEFAVKRGRDPLKFSPDVMDALIHFEWPGNVRELENLAERVNILVSGKTVMMSDLPEKFQKGKVLKPSGSSETIITSDHSGGNVEIPEYGLDMNSIIDDLERDLILKALEKSGGVKNNAARLLGLNRTTLIEKMKKKKIGFQKVITELPKN
jgi:DNA-binding NtrC family response regulator